MEDHKKYRVIVSERAKQMLGTQLRFLAQTSKSAATKEKKLITSAIRSLSEMPQRFPFLDEEMIPRNKYRKMFVERRYLVLYQIWDDVVNVTTIIDCRQDYGWLIR